MLLHNDFNNKDPSSNYSWSLSVYEIMIWLFKSFWFTKIKTTETVYLQISSIKFSHKYTECNYVNKTDKFSYDLAFRFRQFIKIDLWILDTDAEQNLGGNL